MPGLSGRSVFVSIVGGLLGGLIGAGVMSAGHALFTAMASAGTAPPMGSEQEEDATLKVADRISLAVRRRPLSEHEKPVAGHLVHYGFGAAMGAVYGGVAIARPVVTVGAGAGFGAAVWLGAHATVVPALGLSRSPLHEPISKEARELILHLAFGVAVGLVWKAVIRTPR